MYFKGAKVPESRHYKDFLVEYSKPMLSSDLAGIEGFSCSINLATGVLIEVFSAGSEVTALTIADSVLQEVIINHTRVGGLGLSLGVLGTGIGVGGCCGFVKLNYITP